MLGAAKVHQHVSSSAFLRRTQLISTSISSYLSKNPGNAANLLCFPTVSMSTNHKSKRKNHGSMHMTNQTTKQSETTNVSQSSNLSGEQPWASGLSPQDSADSGVRLTPEQLESRAVYTRNITKSLTKADLIALEADLIKHDHLRAVATSTFEVSEDNFTRMYTLNSLRLSFYDKLLKQVDGELMPEVANMLIRDAARVAYYMCSFLNESQINNKSTLLVLTTIFNGALGRASIAISDCTVSGIERLEVPTETITKALQIIEQHQVTHKSSYYPSFIRLMDSLAVLAQPLPKVGDIDLATNQRLTAANRADLLTGRLVAVVVRVYSDTTECMRFLGGVWYVTDLVLADWMNQLFFAFKPMVDLVEKQSKLVLDTLKPDETGSTIWSHADTIPVAAAHAQGCQVPLPGLAVRSHFTERSKEQADELMKLYSPVSLEGKDPASVRTSAEIDAEKGIMHLQRQADWVPLELWDEWGMYQLMRHCVTQSLATISDVRKQFVAYGVSPEKKLLHAILALSNLASLIAPIRPTAYFEDPAIAAGAAAAAVEADDATQRPGRYVGGVGSVCRWMDMLDEQWKGILSASAVRELHLANVLRHHDIKHTVPDSDPLNGLIRISPHVSPAAKPTQRDEIAISTVDKQFLVDVRYARAYRGFVSVRTPELANYDPLVQAGVCSVYGQHAPGQLVIPVRKHPMVLERAHTLLQTTGVIELPGVKSTVLLPANPNLLVDTLATVPHTLSDAAVSRALARKQHRTALERKWLQELDAANVSHDTEAPLVPFFPVFNEYDKPDVTWEELRPAHYIPDVDLEALAEKAGKQVRTSQVPTRHPGTQTRLTPEILAQTEDLEEPSLVLPSSSVRTIVGAADKLFGDRTVFQGMWQSFLMPGFSKTSKAATPDTYFSLDLDKPENIFCGDICVSALYALLDDNEIHTALLLARSLIKFWQRDPTSSAATHASRIALTLLEGINPHFVKYRALIDAYLNDQTTKDPATAAADLAAKINWKQFLAGESSETIKSFEKTFADVDVNANDDFALEMFRSLATEYPAGMHKQMLNKDRQDNLPLNVDMARIRAMYIATLATDVATMTNNRAMISAQVVGDTLAHNADIAISRPGQIMPSPESASAAGLTIPALEQASGYDKLGVAHIGLLRHVLERSCYESEALLDDSRALKIYAPRMLMHKPVADTDIATVLRTIEAAKKGYLIADLNRDHTAFHALHPINIADALATADYNIASNYSNMNGLDILPRVETSEFTSALARALYHLRTASLIIQAGLEHEKTARPVKDLLPPPQCQLATTPVAVVQKIATSMLFLQRVLHYEAGMYSTLRDEIFRATTASKQPLEQLAIRPWSQLPPYHDAEDATYAQQTLDFNLSLLEHDLLRFDEVSHALTDYRQLYNDALPNSRTVSIPPSRLDHAYTLLAWAAVQSHFTALSSAQTISASIGYHALRQGIKPTDVFPRIKPLNARLPTVPPVVDSEQVLAMVELEQFGSQVSYYMSQSLTSMSYAMLEIAKALSVTADALSLKGKVALDVYTAETPLIVGQPRPEQFLVAKHPLPSLSVLHLAYADAEPDQLISWTESFVNSMLVMSFLNKFHNSLDMLYTPADGSQPPTHPSMIRTDSTWKPPKLTDMAELPRSPFFVPHLLTLATCKQLKGEYEAAEALYRTAMWHAYAKPVDTTPPQRVWRPDWENSQRLGEAMQMSYHTIGMRPYGIMKEDGPTGVTARTMTTIVQQYGALLERMGRLDEAALVFSHFIATDPQKKFN